MAPFFFMRYGVSAEKSLANAIRLPEVADRLFFVARACAVLPVWWSALDTEGILPMPADVVFLADGNACLLATPGEPLPPISALLAHVERPIYLPPEVLRGNAVDPRALGLYAAGVWLTLALRPAISGPAEELLLRAAGNPLFSKSVALPEWFTLIEAVQDALALAGRFLDPDPAARVQLNALAEGATLERCALRMRPAVAVQELRERRQFDRALTVANAFLGLRPTVDLALQAAGIAWQDMRQAHTTVRYYEGAKSLAPSDPRPYREQLPLLLPPHSQMSRQAAEQWVTSLGLNPAWYAVMLIRDLAVLAPEEQESLEAAVAICCWLWDSM